MNIYVNGFSCSTRNDGDEFIIHFTQAGPHFGEDGSVTDVMVENVSELVMSYDTAEKLGNAVLSLLRKSDAPAEESDE